MGKIQLIEKITKALEGDVAEEPQVVYVLSRIRKYLELNRISSKYKYLNFYCNWALHSRIDNTKDLDELGIFGNEDNFDLEISFMIHQQFFHELAEFCKEFLGGEMGTYKDRDKLTRTLNAILSDTPLIIKRCKQWEIIIKDDNVTGTYWHSQPAK